MCRLTPACTRRKSLARRHHVICHKAVILPLADAPVIGGHGLACWENQRLSTRLAPRGLTVTPAAKDHTQTL